MDISKHIFCSPEFASVMEAAVNFFETTPVYALPPPDKFIGSGVYALYYKGSGVLYARIARLNQSGFTCPIYVGKAVPPGWRAARTFESRTPDLYGRLEEHARSITQAANLNLEDFYCRFVILTGVESSLIGPLEAVLIRKYKPVWNTVVDGFGNHDPGRGRYEQSPSEWDVLHPGRPWVRKLQGRPPAREEILEKLRSFLEALPFPEFNNGFV
jgi:hypothetical protein